MDNDQDLSSTPDMGSDDSGMAPNEPSSDSGAPMPGSDPNPCKLYVGNLSWSVGFDDLRQLFSEFGNVVDSVVIADKFTHQSKGFGFVTMSTEEEAEAAIKGMHGKDIDGRPLVVNVAQPPEDTTVNPKKLYVGNLSWNVTTEDLKELFSEFGTVEEALVMSDRFTGRSKGFGFVTMSTDEEAQAAIAGMHERPVDNRPLTVNVAQPPEKRAPRGGGFGGGDRGGDRGGGGGYGGGGYGGGRGGDRRGGGGFGGGRGGGGSDRRGGGGGFYRSSNSGGRSDSRWI
jgi:RNA recognition motif-containing protein